MCKTGFTHDENARNDERLLNVRAHEGAEGYGIYFMILERLCQSEDFTSVRDYRLLAFDFRVSSGKVMRVVENYGLFLFTPDGERFYSERFARQMKEVEKAAQKRALSGKKGAEVRWDKKDAWQMPPKSMANAIKNDGNAINDENEKREREKEEESAPHTPLKEEVKERDKKNIYKYARACEADSELLEGEGINTPVNTESPETDAPGRAAHNGEGAETLHADGETLQVEHETLQADSPGEDISPFEAFEVIEPEEVRSEADEVTELAREAGKKKFFPPSVEEVAAYVAEKGYTNVDPVKFVAHHGAKGWMLGKSKMKSWRLAVTTWHKNDYESRNNYRGKSREDAAAEERRRYLEQSVIEADREARAIAERRQQQAAALASIEANAGESSL